MGTEKLTKDSTPCEICKELSLAKDVHNAHFALTAGYLTGCGNDTCYCLQKDRALIKLAYLNLITNRAAENKE